ncbi:TetR/AcrR family transcriptional regulator [Mycobacterium riyadhense]|uniref:TetR family transcriptional regulator n=1 Tax=Mycobacterium riyadhense TaxID=486698 RepID=A0A1X2CW25_9MYCO|nr:TetR/AcrR family transcriptional regulator [Mycobacterium riyadhense]MCV7145298.1 TetR/AcrR family transcriptional regulator [Mycobacterium riyadhense]ORW80125.1 TetR family transcriptional regulator [Mycobacterium riyadhense]VTP03555.1 HTH-type transcriptional regulator SrpR [Mycobacterium riyadhense]
MTQTQLGRPVGASGEETRQRIIVATMRCVSEVGYSRATIRQIARTANVTSASLYNYFPNKSELIKATIAARADAAMPRLRQAAAIDGNIIDRIEAILDECGRLISAYPDLAAFEWAIRANNAIDSDGLEAPGEPAPQVEPAFANFREIIEGVVDEACRQGDLGDHPDRRGTVEAIYALMYGLTELAATMPLEAYQASLNSSKELVRGTLFRRSP